MPKTAQKKKKQKKKSFKKGSLPVLPFEEPAIKTYYPTNSQKPILIILTSLSFIFGLSIIILQFWLRQQKISQTSFLPPSPTPIPLSTPSPENIPLSSQETPTSSFSLSQRVDFNLCLQENNYQKELPFGSTYLMIRQKSADFCLIEIANETEDRYITYHCQVPRSLGLTLIELQEYGTNLSPIRKYCRQISSGYLSL